MANLKDLIVNGVSRFLGKVYINDSQITTINGVTVGDSPKFTDTTALGSMTGTLGVDHGGTGATSASAARTSLGLGSAATASTATSVGNNSNLPTGAAIQTYVTGLGYEANQNAFSNVTVGSTTIAADSKTDTLTLVAGSNVTLTPDATNDKVTIAATNTTYESKAAVSGGTDVSLVTTGEKYTWNSKASNTGTITGVSANGTSVATSGVANIPAASTSAYGVTKLSDATNSTSTALAATANAVKKAYDHGGVTSVNGSTGAVTISNATGSAAGLMSATDKSNLDSLVNNIENGTYEIWDVTASDGYTSGDAVTITDHTTTPYEDMTSLLDNSILPILRFRKCLYYYAGSFGSTTGGDLRYAFTFSASGYTRLVLAIYENESVIYTAPTGGASEFHRSTDATYGIGSENYYGHNKVINNLTTASYTEGESLSAYQGKVLKDLIDENVKASYLETPHANGYTTDTYGNFIHKSTGTGNTWNIKSNDGTCNFIVNFENGNTETKGTFKSEGNISSSANISATGNISAGGYLSSTGGAWIEGNHVTIGTDQTPYSQLVFKTTNNNANSGYFIRAYDASTDGYGQTWVMKPGGNMIIGGGEFASNLYAGGYDDCATNAGEDLYLGADSATHIYSNANTIEDRKEWTFSTAGTFWMPDGVGRIASDGNVYLNTSSVTGWLSTILNGKQDKISGAVTTITDSNLTGNRALISNSSGKVAVSAVTSTELGYLDGATSNIQTQINNLKPVLTNNSTGLNNVSVTSSTNTNVGSFQLTAGTWIITITGIWTETNTTGVRQLWISSTSTGNALSYQGMASNNPVGANAPLHQQCTIFAKPTATTTYYIVAKQTSSVAQTISTRYSLCRLST